MDDTVKLRIDGTELEVESGTTILDAAKSVGIFIPTLCHCLLYTSDAADDTSEV